MRTHQRLGKVITITSIAFAALITNSSLAYANTIGRERDCSQHRVVRKTDRLRIQAFAGHSVEFYYDLCIVPQHRAGFVGPIANAANSGKVVFANDPNISTPTRYPGGGVVETVEVKPGNWRGDPRRPQYTFQIKQEIVRVVGEQTFNFHVSVKDGPLSGWYISKRIQMCMGNTCVSKHLVP